LSRRGMQSGKLYSRKFSVNSVYSPRSTLRFARSLAGAQRDLMRQSWQILKMLNANCGLCGNTDS
jgi:hypothetical protein